ncbi:MAG: phage minor head protein [Planctomycetota bacterium]
MTVSLLTREDFTPKSFEEAARHFARKTPLTSEAFERLSNLNRARAFRIAGVDKLTLVQRARNLVRRGIREGTDYGKVQRQLLLLFDAEKLEAPAPHRLQAMFRQNTMTAYSQARNEVLRDPEVLEQFPYWKYLTVGNGVAGVNNVRATHAALHGLVFRADDPFWNQYDPPWEYGCRCTKVALTPGQVLDRGIEVRDLSYVQTQVTVSGHAVPGIQPNPDFAFRRDPFDTSFFGPSLDADLQQLKRDYERQANEQS